ncbi:MAG: hypothetical protein ACI38Q_04040 [Candidatus Bruticola sp.]
MAIFPLTIVLSAAAAVCLTDYHSAQASRSGFYLAVSSLILSAAATAVLLAELLCGTTFSYWNRAFAFDISTASLILCLNVVGLAELYLLRKNSAAQLDLCVNILLSIGGLIVCVSCRELVCFALGAALAFWPIVNTLYRQIDSRHLSLLKKADNLVRLQIGASACLLYAALLFLLVNRTTIIDKLTLSAEALPALALLMLLLGTGAEVGASYLICTLMRKLHDKACSRLIFLNAALISVPLLISFRLIHNFLFSR